jgi:hypothetical protein
MGEYSVRLANVLAKSRGDASFNLFLAVAFLVVNLVLLRSRGTYIYVFSGLFVIQLVFGVIRRFKLRDRSPIVIALHEPTTLARVQGWPYAGGKYPPGKVPQFVIATIASGSKVRLKIGEERELRGFVAALREAAPQLDIVVPNVDAPKPA